jgi:hypothetical protein
VFLIDRIGVLRLTERLFPIGRKGNLRVCGRSFLIDRKRFMTSRKYVFPIDRKGNLRVCGWAFLIDRKRFMTSRRDAFPIDRKGNLRVCGGAFLKDRIKLGQWVWARMHACVAGRMLAREALLCAVRLEATAQRRVPDRPNEVLGIIRIRADGVEVRS